MAVPNCRQHTFLLSTPSLRGPFFDSHLTTKGSARPHITPKYHSEDPKQVWEYNRIATDMSTSDQQTKAPADLRNVVQFLRGSNSGMKIRVGALNGKRIDYFKGASHPNLTHRMQLTYILLCRQIRLKSPSFTCLREAQSSPESYFRSGSRSRSSVPNSVHIFSPG